MPPAVYVIGVLGAIGSLMNIVSTFNVGTFIMSIFTLIIFTGLILKFSFARHVTVGLCIIYVILSLIFLYGLRLEKNDEIAKYNKTQHALTNGSFSSIFTNNTFIAQNITDKHNATLKEIRTEQTAFIISAVLYSIETVYLFSPRVKAAFKN